jgi:hypothetical protein
MSKKINGVRRASRTGGLRLLDNKSNPWSCRIPFGEDVSQTKHGSYQAPMPPAVPKYHPLFRAVQEEDSRREYLTSLQREGPKEASNNTKNDWLRDRKQRIVEREIRWQSSYDTERVELSRAFHETSSGYTELDDEAMAKLRQKAQDALQSRASAAQRKRLPRATSSVTTIPL